MLLSVTSVQHSKAHIPNTLDDVVVRSSISRVSYAFNESLKYQKGQLRFI